MDAKGTSSDHRTFGQISTECPSYCFLHIGEAIAGFNYAPIPLEFPLV